MKSFLELFQDKKVCYISDCDLDGIASIILSYYYIEPLTKFFSVFSTGDRTMEEIPKNVFDSNYDIFLFTDLAPTLEFAKEILKHNKEIIIVDHHQTSTEILEELNLENYYYSDNICATKLLYNLIIENLRRNRVIDTFVHLVDVYDSWRENHEDWETAKDLEYLKVKSVDWRTDANKDEFTKNRYFINNILDKFDNDKKFVFKYMENKRIKAERDKEKKSYNEAKKKMKLRVDNKGKKYIYTECPNKVSLVSNRILKENNNVDYILCRSTYYKAVNNLSFSLRSKNDFNVREIAERFDGGGHLNASGFLAKDEQEYNALINGNLHPQ